LCNLRTFRELLAPGYAVVDFAIRGQTAKIHYCASVHSPLDKPSANEIMMQVVDGTLAKRLFLNNDRKILDHLYPRKRGKKSCVLSPLIHLHRNHLVFIVPIA